MLFVSEPVILPTLLTLHLTPLGTNFCLLVRQTVAIKVLKTNNLGGNKSMVKSKHLLDCSKHFFSLTIKLFY